MLEPIDRLSDHSQINPLAAPNDGQWLERFRTHFHLDPTPDPVASLESIATAFARLPYENLTKIIKQADTARAAEARRTPPEVLAHYFRWQTGGTCFSLTATLLYLVRTIGLRAEPILADRRYGANTHCALVVWIDRVPHLLDPGYLIVKPIALTISIARQVRTPFNTLELTPIPQTDRLELRTIDKGQSKYRLTFKTTPVDAGEFLRAWDESFDWEMMQYPVLTTVRNGAQLYLQGHRYQVRTNANVLRAEMNDEELAQRIVSEFGIDPSIAQRALHILARRNK